MFYTVLEIQEDANGARSDGVMTDGRVFDRRRGAEA